MLVSLSMKKFFTTVFLLFGTLLIFNVPAHSGDRKKCADSAAEAYTESASRILYSACIRDNNMVFKTKRHKCALKAAKAKTESASRRIYSLCIR